jgi:hypothetical protein
MPPPELVVLPPELVVLPPELIMLPPELVVVPPELVVVPPELVVVPPLPLEMGASAPLHPDANAAVSNTGPAKVWKRTVDKGRLLFM